MPKKIHSRAQWALLFAKAGRGQIHGGVAKVREMAKGVDYGSLPAKVKKQRLRRKVIGRE